MAHYRYDIKNKRCFICYYALTNILRQRDEMALHLMELPLKKLYFALCCDLSVGPSLLVNGVTFCNKFLKPLHVFTALRNLGTSSNRVTENLLMCVFLRLFSRF